MGKGTMLHEFTSGVRDLENFSQGQLAVDTSAAQTAALPEGIYAVWCAVAVHMKIAPTANDVTANNGYLLRANTTELFYVRANSKIGAIAGSSSTLAYHKID